MIQKKNEKDGICRFKSHTSGFQKMPTAIACGVYGKAYGLLSYKLGLKFRLQLKIKLDEGRKVEIQKRRGDKESA